MSNKNSKFKKSYTRRKKNPPSRWLVFYTRPRNEKKCEKKLREIGIEVFLPKCRVERQWSDRIKKVMLPLFPNYIFARVNEKERIKVLKTAGIVTMVTFGDQPAVMDECEIENLRITQNNPERLESLSYSLPDPGSRVVVKGGPFEGLAGYVVEQRSGKCVVVEITSIGKAVKVHLKGGKVEEIDSTESSAEESNNPMFH
jgi:transcription antitermination factor NusG